MFYVDIFIQFLDLEILSDLVSESLCYYRHKPDSDLLEELKRLLPPLFISRYTVGSSIVWGTYMVTELPARSGLHSPLSAYCSSNRLNPSEIASD